MCIYSKTFSTVLAENIISVLSGHCLMINAACSACLVPLWLRFLSRIHASWDKNLCCTLFFILESPSCSMIEYFIPKICSVFMLYCPQGRWNINLLAQTSRQLNGSDELWQVLCFLKRQTSSKVIQKWFLKIKMLTAGSSLCKYSSVFTASFNNSLFLL